MSNPADSVIEIDTLIKEFTLRKGDTSLLRTFLHRKRWDKKTALTVNACRIQAGEKLAIIGRNGSGKSTLLKTIAGVYTPNKGQLLVRGNSLYVSGYSFALSPDLSMRQNVFLVAQIFGVPRARIPLLYSNIVNFSGLHGYDEVYVAQFSSGMYTRLGFSCMKEIIMETRPEILLLDEALDVGTDEMFRTRALNWLENEALAHRTVILATHNLESVERMMNRVLLLERGEILFDGDPSYAITRYREILSACP